MLWWVHDSAETQKVTLYGSKVFVMLLMFRWHNKNLLLVVHVKIHYYIEFMFK